MLLVLQGSAVILPDLHAAIDEFAGLDEAIHMLGIDGIHAARSQNQLGAAFLRYTKTETRHFGLEDVGFRLLALLVFSPDMLRELLLGEHISPFCEGSFVIKRYIERK
jgi:hypothetical protein